MLIDDEPFIINTLESLLENDYEVVSCQSATAAWDLLQNEEFANEIQLIISDQRMPGMTGVELLTRVKSLYPDIIRILLTGYSDVSAIIDAVNEGEIYKYINKPIQSHDLQVTVKRALENWNLADQNKQLVSELKQANDSLEVKVKERTVKLENTLEALEDKNRKLSEMMKERERFLTIMAHDLKSPLSGILECTKLLSTDLHQLSKDEINGFVQVLHPGVNSMFDLLDNLLNLAKVQQQREAYLPSSINPEEVLTAIEHLITANLKVKDIKLETDFAPDARAFVNTSHITMILRNLVGNAIKFTPKGGLIQLRTSLTPDGEFLLTVKDNGIGIAENKKDLIFDPTHKTTSKGTEGEKGTGLGLILCKELAEASKGSLTFESEQGVGSEFFLTLPKA